MSLPNEDPSNPALPAPLFADTDAVRGDQLRANNQLIYENETYLDEGQNINDAAAATPVDADRVGFYQIAGSIIKYVTFANLFLWIVGKFYALTGKTTPADADQFFITDSAASNVGKSLTWANIKATLKTYFDGIYSTKIKYAYFADVKAVNTSGGSSTSGSRATRTIAEIYDPDNIATVASDQVTLQAGTYLIRYRTPAFKSGALRSWLRNVTDSSDAIDGNTAYAETGSSVQIDSGGEKVITIASAKAFRVEIQVGVSQATNGLGVAANMTSSEVYTEMWVYQLA